MGLHGELRGDEFVLVDLGLPRIFMGSLECADPTSDAKKRDGVRLLTEVVFENHDPGGDQFDQRAEPLPIAAIQIVGVRHSLAPLPRNPNFSRAHHRLARGYRKVLINLRASLKCLPCIDDDRHIFLQCAIGQFTDAG